MSVPEVLLSGHHEKIDRWRKKESLRNTLIKRPDLLEGADLTLEDIRTIERLKGGRE
jgi:tRNA (guanine37-N1)-methyltransferase